MAKVAYILLCHKDPAGIIRQAEGLTAAGDFVVIHFDARAKAEDYDALCKALSRNANVAFVKCRIKCGWGEWSLVQATLNAIDTGLRRFREASNV